MTKVFPPCHLKLRRHKNQKKMVENTQQIISEGAWSSVFKVLLIKISLMS